jgi:hypothetical protein
MFVVPIKFKISSLRVVDSHSHRVSEVDERLQQEEWNIWGTRPTRIKRILMPTFIRVQCAETAKLAFSK